MRRSARDRDRASTIVAEISVLLSTGIAALSILNVNRQLVIAIVTPVILLLIGLFFITRRLYSVMRINTTIAIAGPLQAGKTVYINVLCNQLFEGESFRLSFVPETRTVQQVYRIVGDIRNGLWPKQTARDHIDRYEGIIGFNKLPLIRVLLNGRLEFKVEFGDAAGENWERLAHEADSRLSTTELGENQPKRLIDTNFFTYVGQSDCLFYLIDASKLASPHTVEECVDDLLSTLQLLRRVDGVRPSMPLARPLAVILSKVDIIPAAPREILEKMLPRFSGDASAESDWHNGLDHKFNRSVSHLLRLAGVLARQSSSYRFFMVSSLAEATSGRPQSVVERAKLDDWQLFRTEEPLEWVFDELWRLRRFRAST